MRCRLESHTCVLFGDKVFDGNETLTDFSGHPLTFVFNVATRQSKITYAAHILFLLDSEDIHRGDGRDLCTVLSLFPASSAFPQAATHGAALTPHKSWEGKLENVWLPQLCAFDEFTNAAGSDALTV